MFLKHSEKKRGFPWFWTIFLLGVGSLFIGGMLKGQGDPPGSARVTATCAQVKAYTAAVESFRELYKALPGDMPNAGKVIAGCIVKNGTDCNPYPPAAGDGIVGMIDLSKSWKEQTITKMHIPAVSAADESVLFWSHLQKAELIAGIAEQGITDGTPFASGVTHPAAKTGGGFIAGHLDGSPLPTSLAPKSSGIAGTILLLVSDKVLRGEAELNDEGQQALMPLRAAQIDRKMDDGRANTGYVQAYGSPDCFLNTNDGQYNETSKYKSCGLIFRIAD